MLHLFYLLKVSPQLCNIVQQLYILRNGTTCTANSKWLDSNFCAKLRLPPVLSIHYTFSVYHKRRPSTTLQICIQFATILLQSPGPDIDTRVTCYCLQHACFVFIFESVLFLMKMI